MAAILLKDEVYYPESDGQPMGETEVHIDEILELLAALKRRYREAADVYVGADMLLYYVQGEPGRCICPDVFVTVGIPKRPKRRSYFLWKEGRPPSFVIEVTSAGSRREDQEKKVLYAQLGVQEYFLHDPLGEYLKPALQGYRLAGGEYRPIKPAADGSLASEVTGLLLHQEGGSLRLIDSKSGEQLLWREEQDLALEAERKARLAAEEEVARLRRELEGRKR
jgi:Uma2 family endonuclease